MAATKFSALLQRRTNRIARVLIYAVLEWTLISLLLLNSLFSLLIHRFATFFGLKPPCVFCSRLDHHFSQPQKTKSSFSLDIICEQHAAEISKTGYCSKHKKLLDSQRMCLDCSSSSHDAALFSWMREIGIVRTGDLDADGDDDDVRKCSCCDGVIGSSSLDQNSRDLVFNQRGKVDFNSDPKFGYGVLFDDEKEEEGGVGLNPEKVSELKSDDEDKVEFDKNISNEEKINLCPDTLPQHLEFYIDHDDYRLIPVDLVNSMKLQKQGISSHEEDSSEFELVFEGDELRSGCLFMNKENLPCIKEDEGDIHRVVDVEDEDEDEDEDNIGISQPQQEENKGEERSSETMHEQETEKMELSQFHQEENSIVEKSYLNLQEQEEENMEVSQFHQEVNQIEESTSPNSHEEMEEQMEVLPPLLEANKIEELSLLNFLEEEDMIDGRNLSNVVERVEEIDISQKNEERNLKTLEEEEEDEDEELEISQHLEENLIDERSSQSVVEQVEGIEISQKNEERSLETLEEDEDEDEKSEISQHLEENLIDERNLQNVLEQVEGIEISQKNEERSLETFEEEGNEKLEVSQHLENMIEESHLTSVEDEEETMEISQHFENMTDERNLPNVVEQMEEIGVSQKNEERSLETLEEDEKLEISQHLEENMNLPNVVEQVEEIEISQKNVERSLETLVEEEDEDKKLEISQHLEEDLIEESNLASLEDEQETMEISEHFIEDNSIEDRSLHTLQHEGKEDRVTDPTEIASSTPLANNGDIIAKVNGESLKVSVSLYQTELEEERIPDTPSSVESLQNLHKKLMLLGRRESCTDESLDGIIVSELEGGDGSAVVEKLKSELYAERKALRALYKELEEERSASAIAANQTMAMINRLQEEKATIQMEALQYQRMLEEQSEYDQEALQMMNELMVKREKEKHELEKEFEVLRKKLVEYEERERVRLLSRRREGRNSSASCSFGEESDGLSIDLNHETKDHDEDHGENGHQDTPCEAVLGLEESLAGFEEERQAIIEQLKGLEEKLFTLAEEEEENDKDFDANGSSDNGWKLNVSMQKRLLPLFDAAQFMDSPPDAEFDYLESNKSPVVKFELEKKRLAIEEDVEVVYERLQALEADREFLRHCVGSLRKGDKGLELLQEILQHLRDLKSVELQARKNMDHCPSV